MSTRDAKGTSGTFLGNRNAPIGWSRGGTLEPYNGPSCVEGPRWTHYEIYGVPLLEDNLYGTRNTSCGGACTTPFCIEPMICVMGVSARICPTGLRLTFPPRSTLLCNLLSTAVTLWCHQVDVKIFGYQESIPVGALADGRENVVDG